jgi:hypothetical protein
VLGLLSRSLSLSFNYVTGNKLPLVLSIASYGVIGISAILLVIEFMLVVLYLVLYLSFNIDNKALVTSELPLLS